jgi:hypothetical protein
VYGDRRRRLEKLFQFEIMRSALLLRNDATGRVARGMYRTSPVSVLDGFLLHVEHRSPDGNPSSVAALEDPEIATHHAASCAAALVDHLISKRDHCCLTGNVDLAIVFTELMNGRVRAEILKSREKRVPSLDSPGESRKDHHDSRMYER